MHLFADLVIFAAVLQEFGDFGLKYADAVALSQLLAFGQRNRATTVRTGQIEFCQQGGVMLEKLRMLAQIGRNLLGVGE